MSLSKYKIKYSLIFSLVLYLSINIFVFLNEKHLENQLESYDLNKSGFFEENEITEMQQIAMEKVSNDTARTLAPFTTIPVIIILGFAFWLILKFSDKKERKLDTID